MPLLCLLAFKDKGEILYKKKKKKIEQNRLIQNVKFLQNLLGKVYEQLELYIFSSEKHLSLFLNGKGPRQASFKAIKL